MLNHRSHRQSFICIHHRVIIVGNITIVLQHYHSSWSFLLVRCTCTFTFSQLTVDCMVAAICTVSMQPKQLRQAAGVVVSTRARHQRPDHTVSGIVSSLEVSGTCDQHIICQHHHQVASIVSHAQHPHTLHHPTLVIFVSSLHHGWVVLPLAQSCTQGCVSGNANSSSKLFPNTHISMVRMLHMMYITHVDLIHICLSYLGHCLICVLLLSFSEQLLSFQRQLQLCNLFYFSCRHLLGKQAQKNKIYQSLDTYWIWQLRNIRTFLYDCLQHVCSKLYAGMRHYVSQNRYLICLFVTLHASSAVVSHLYLLDNIDHMQVAGSYLGSFSLSSLQYGLNCS